MLLNKLVLNSTKNQREILYRGFIQEFFFEEEISNPEYELLVEGDETETGEFIPKRTEWRKYVTVVLPVRDQVYLGLIGATLCDSCKLIDIFGQTYPLKEVSLKANRKQSAYFTVTIKMTLDTVVKKSA